MYYDYIQISKINDFIFCPYSLYFHSVYEGFDSFNYKSKSQIAGKIVHKNIDNISYSSQKNVIQGMEVFSDDYQIIGKIDIYNKYTKELIERKRKIEKIYDGYIFQLYAQKICLEEMGYKVEKMTLYSIVNNKSFNISMLKDQIEKFDQNSSFYLNFDQIFQSDL
ncbi:MAG: type V CRISPR-associated protein Cas4, partial [Candidatus Muiribacteriota bacterium]